MEQGTALIGLSIVLSSLLGSALASETTTMATALITTQSVSACRQQWEPSRDKTSTGASQYVGPRTIQQCLDYCNNNTNCVAVDIDVNMVPLSCWHHLDANDLTDDNTYYQQGTNQYRLVKRCLDSTPASVCYNPDWSVLTNQSAVGAVQQIGPASVQECLDYCGQTAVGCVAADVDLTKSPPTCWLHFSTSNLNASNIYPQTGVNEYQLITKCASGPIQLSTTTTTTQPSTTSANTCERWQVVRDQTSTGAVQYIGPRTIQQCLDYCNNNTNCVAVDIDVNMVPLRCWPHFLEDDLSDDNTFYQAGTNQYRVVRSCPYTPTASVCYNPDWSVLANQSAVGAVQQIGPASVQECLDYCGQTAVGCVAADVDLTESPPACWLHFSRSNLNASNIYPQTGVNEYQLITKCASGPIQKSTTTSTTQPTTSVSTCQRWQVVRDHTSTGAVQYIGPRTIQQCLDYCNNNTNCVAVDIDVNIVPLRCWPHFVEDDLTYDNTFYQAGTNQYRVVRSCPYIPTASVCYNPDWSVLTNQSAVGAVQQLGPASVQECLDYCGQTAVGCVAADVDLTKSPPTCWLHFSTSNLNASNIYPQTGVNEYQLITKCASGPIQLSTTTTTTQPSTTSANTCERWQVVRDQTSTGAVQYIGPRTIQQCLDYCNNNTNCVAVDIDVNMVPLRCWPHFLEDDLSDDNTFYQAGTNQYRVVRSCPYTPTASVCYNPDWSVLANQSAVGAVQQIGPASVQECLDYCGQTAVGCVAADVDLTESPPACWLHFSRSNLNASNIYPQTGVNEYQLITKCASGPIQKSTTTSTTQPTTSVSNCQRWQVVRDQTSTGAVQYIGPRTIQQCLDYCNNNTNCVALDIDVNMVPLRCWPHFLEDDLSDDNSFYQAGTNQYRVVRSCPYTPTASVCYNPDWSVLANQSAVGAVQQIGPASVQECLDYCGQTAVGCVAADVDLTESPPACWLHFSRSNLNASNIYPQTGVNEYQLITKCASGPIQKSTTTSTTQPTTSVSTCQRWQVVRDQTSTGAVQYIGPRTIQQCLDYCNNNTNCVAVDIDVNMVPLRCWPHFVEDDLTYDNTFYQAGTNQYRVVRSCPYIPTASVCYNPDWSVLTNQSAVGAVQQIGPASVQECLDYCGQTAVGCVAADVDLTKSLPTCWLHFSTSDLVASNIYPQTGVNEYQLINKCASGPIQMSTTTTTTTQPSTTTANTCQRWQVVRDQTSTGAVQYIGPRTIQQCLDYCNNNTNCVAVDIDVNMVPLRCWPHLNADDLIYNNTYYQQGTDQYRLSARCYNNVPASVCYNPDWSVLTNQSAVGAVQQFGPASVQECLDYCGQTAVGCVAADVDLTKSPPACWLHFSTSNLNASNIYTQPGVNQYQLINKCASGPIQPTTTISATSPTSPSTTSVVLTSRTTPHEVVSVTVGPAAGSPNIALIVGLSVGIGVPLLVVLIIAVILLAKNCSRGKAWGILSVKGIIGPIVGSKNLEQGHFSVAPSLSTASTQPIAQASVDSDQLPEATFYWAPEKPQRVAHVNQGYAEEDE